MSRSKYLDYNEYAMLNADAMSQQEFNLFEYDAETWIDEWTLTVDGVQKLRVAFPTDEADAMAVKRCMIALVKACKDMADYEALSVAGQNGVVASVSSGTESMSFVRGGSALARAVGDDTEKQKYIRNIVRRYLAGHCDANGVNLLYGGTYPVIQGATNVS